MLSILLLTQTLSGSYPVVALPSDRNQPITIQSDKALRDEKTGLTVYAGNVKITQGTLLITADNISLLNNERGLYKVVAKGKPARYRQRPALDKPMIEAEGNTIEYHADTQVLHLIENASLNQDGTVMQGSKINYDIQKQLVTASGDTGNGKTTQTETAKQIVIVIPPNTIASPAAKNTEENNQEFEPTSSVPIKEKAD